MCSDFSSEQTPSYVCKLYTRLAHNTHTALVVLFLANAFIIIDYCCRFSDIYSIDYFMLPMLITMSSFRQFTLSQVLIGEA